ncbi:MULTISPECIES: DUF4270 domain-containing protein [unclassified Flavobacterium]|uniref:DUF4270 domain-containing protein n=1 Tax=unclassified Flavobacterium TaxID=196869 RepID=UPI001291E5F1|nr:MULTISPECIES: DUF4270 domain-containing protein [unclassified Flavobacterium]MQP51347.1 DUF4270 family protein [Flavobacterium sp. LMO9]MQP61424.1 DUF4270 family protein [Flavobacterium sp. LMO6]
MKKSFLKISSLLFLFVLIISCDKDFNSLDSDVIGDNHFDLEKYEVENLIAYTKDTGPVQANNLPLNALGIYDNPKFGLTKAHFVTQVELGTENPSFGYDPVIDSVYLYVPYFSSLQSTETSGERIYELDSIYGNTDTGKFKLSVVENGYYLRDYDPTDNLQSSQKYYSDDKALIDPFKGTEILNNSAAIAQNNEFYFSNKELYIYKTDGSGLYVDSNGDVLSDQNDTTLRVIKERKTPGMWLDLKSSYFQQKILDATASGNLFNNNIFKNYFRGLLFEVEEISAGQGALAILDFSRAELKILYKASADPTVDNPDPIRTRREFLLKMGYNSSSTLRNNSINFLEHTNSVDYQAGLGDSDEILGSNKLFIKGGNGSVAFIDLFGNGELETLRNNVTNQNWLVNDAILTFYIDKTSMVGVDKDSEPERIYIFDATNNVVIIDYSFDSSTSSNSKNNKVVFGGIIQRETDDDKKGIKYTVRLTEHIKSVLKADDNGDYQDNIKIGISVTESINLVSTATIKNPILANGVEVESIPLASILNPLGTILFGNVITNPDDADKKLKLNIYFTKPN